jgi:hypothetical protein
MRFVPLIVCTSLAGACFATEPLMIGELASEGQAMRDASTPRDAGSLEPPRFDATVTQDEDASPASEVDAGRPPAQSDDDRERDAGGREDARASLSDAAMPDASYTMEPGPDTNRDSGSGADSGTASGVSDAGSDAARNLLCTFEPWHCL